MTKIIAVCAFILVLFGISNGQVYDEDQYPTIHFDEWNQMHKSKDSTVEWFRDAKYGMFIHFGLYSIPGGVWKSKTIEEMNNPPNVAEWIMHTAKIPREEYKLLAKQFNPVKFNADSIAKLAKDAGMKYLVITAKHCDGFALFDSDVNDFNVVDASPYGRDIIKDLHAACKKYGIEFGLYYSQHIDWMDGSDALASANKDNPDLPEWLKTFCANTWDPSPNSYDDYLKNKSIPQIKEFLTKFPDLKMIWFDAAIRSRDEDSYTFYKTVYDIQPQIIITERIGGGFGDYTIPGDNTIPKSADHLKKPWETVGTTNNSWGFKSYDHDFKKPKEILFWLIEIVSKGGNYMLNIGPDGQGAVPQESIYNLLTVGKWLKTNGEAVYGTKRWNITKEGPTEITMGSTEDREAKGFQDVFTPEDFWFTQKNNFLYAISLADPKESAIIQSFNTSIGYISDVEILGYGKVSFKQTADSLIVDMPKGYNPENGFVIKVTMSLVSH